MTDAEQITPDAKGARQLHMVLTGGLTVVLVAMALIVFFWGSRLGSGSFSTMFGYGLAGIGCLPIVMALILFRPKIPRRERDQSLESFWPEALPRALVTWVLIEGGGIIASVGFVNSGTFAPAVVAILAILVLVWLRPGSIAAPRS